MTFVARAPERDADGRRQAVAQAAAGAGVEAVGLR